MANENIGEMPWKCHEGALSAYVRLDKRGKLYLACPRCGIFGAKGESFQQRIRNEATMYGTPNSDYKGGGEPVELNKNPEAHEKEAEFIPETIPKNFTPAPEAIPKNQPRKVGSLLAGFAGIFGSEE